jgi:hypothetical protein
MTKIISLSNKINEKQEKARDEERSIQQNYDWAYVCENCGCTDDMRIIVGSSADGDRLDSFIGFRCMCCGAKVVFYDEEEGAIGFELANETDIMEE